MQLATIEQCFRACGGVDEGVQKPAIAFDADLKEHPVLGVGFLQVEHTLLGVSTGVGTELHLPSERPGFGERMAVDEERVVGSVEFYRFAYRRFDDFRMAFDRGLVACDVR